MNPLILKKIADHADIDSRRALGFPPRKLNSNFEINLKDELFSYYPDEKRMVYFNVGWNHIYWEVINNIVPYDITGNMWIYCADCFCRIFNWNSETIEEIFPPMNPGEIYSPVGRPVFIRATS